jgi:succinyl-CoA synthetase beta subunit
MKLKVPVVLRLQGTKVSEANEMITRETTTAEGGVKVLCVDDLDEAAEKAVLMAQMVELAKDTGVRLTMSLRHEGEKASYVF